MKTITRSKAIQILEKYHVITFSKKTLAAMVVSHLVNSDIDGKLTLKGIAKEIEIRFNKSVNIIETTPTAKVLFDDKDDKSTT